MKYLLADCGYTLDTEGVVLKRQDSERQGVNSVYIAKEDCTVTYRDAVAQAEAGDIIVTFYEKDFPMQMIVVKSEDWRKNLEAYNEKQQKWLEEQARKNSVIGAWSDTCCNEACDTCTPTCNAA